MIFAQLTFRESLRDIEACLRAQPDKLYHMGLRSQVARNTLANTNAVRDWRIYAEFAQRLIAMARKLYANEPLGVEPCNTVYALDSTTIDLCLSLFPWAPFRSTKAAVKLHTLLDLCGEYPDFPCAVKTCALPVGDRPTRQLLLMGIEIRLFPVIDAFSRFSGMPLAWYSGLSLRLAKQLLDSTAAASGSGPGLIGVGVAVACWRRYRNPRLAPRIRRILTPANNSGSPPRRWRGDLLSLVPRRLAHSQSARRGPRWVLDPGGALSQRDAALRRSVSP